MDAARNFLDRYPELRKLQESGVWKLILQRYALPNHSPPLYIVRGDTVGDENELLLDTLARGGAPGSTDVLARELFLELSPQLKDVILVELLKNK